MNDYQKELWKKRQEYELAHKDNSKLPVKPKKKKKKVKQNTDNYVTGKTKQSTNKATKDAKNKAHMQDLVNTSKTKQATKKATKDAKRTAHTNDYSNITDSTKNGKKKKSKLKHSDLYLAHHGVEGQKWGKRNGPPYPLDSSISTGHSLKKKNKGVKDGSAPGPYGGTRHTAEELKASIKAKKKTGEKLTDEERLYRNTRRGAMVGGVVGGVIAGAVTNRKIKKEHENEELKKEVRDKLEEYRNSQKDGSSNTTVKFPKGTKENVKKQIADAMTKRFQNSSRSFDKEGLKFSSHRSIDTPKGKVEQFTFYNNDGYFTVTGEMKNGKLILDKSNSGDLDVAWDS